MSGCEIRGLGHGDGSRDALQMLHDGMDLGFDLFIADYLPQHPRSLQLPNSFNS